MPLRFREGRPVVVRFVWDQAVLDKIDRKHGLTHTDVEQAFLAADRRTLRSQANGRQRMRGRSRSGQWIVIVFEAEDDLIYTVTAYVE